jgi:hydroxymethylpyrimidine/phosphomethylpyrimidine kinase
MKTPIALTIAGSDSSGGAGIQADLKTFSALGVYGASVIAALTAQNTTGVTGVHIVPPAFILAQMEAVFDDLDVGAVKIGMVGNEAAVTAVAEGLRSFARAPVILDPVMVAESGGVLLEPGAEAALRSQLLPMADLITPNLPEAARLLGASIAPDEATMIKQGEQLLALGAKAVLVKGGHGEGAEAVDIFLDGSGAVVRLAAERISTRNTHGTGCTLSAAIAAGIALGLPMPDAVRRAKLYLTNALAHADSLKIGKGSGPVHHFHDIWKRLD